MPKNKEKKSKPARIYMDKKTYELMVERGLVKEGEMTFSKAGNSPKFGPFKEKDIIVIKKKSGTSVPAGSAAPAPSPTSAGPDSEKKDEGGTK